MINKDDLAPELLNRIQEEFREQFDKNKKIASLYARVRDGTATYIEAQEFALETGTALVESFSKHLSSDVLPDGKMYYNIAQRILQPTLEENYDLITDVTVQVQKNLNEKAGIGIKPIVPEFNQERIDGLVNKVSSAESFDDVAWVLDEPIKQHAMSIVSDSIKANAEFQYDAGLQPEIVREAEHKCCEWCSRLQGHFRYPDEVPIDVYRRHDRCRCTVDYVVGKKRTDIHHGSRGQKRRYVKDEYGTYVTSKDNRIKKSKEVAATDAERKKDDREKRITKEKNIALKDPAQEREQRINKAKEMTAKDLDRMSLADLKKLAAETATEYYESGLSGISFGNADVRKVAETLAENGSRTSLKKDIISMQKKMRSGNNAGIIKVQKTTLEATPNSITEVVNTKGGIDRNYYDSKGKQSKQISNNDHGKPKQHPYGNHGEHVHDYVYDSEEKLIGRPMRELTEDERKENGDIL